MNKLDLLLKELQEATDQVQTLSNQIRNLLSSSQEVEEQPIEFEKLRGLCADQSRAGFTDQIRELIHSFGAKKLSELEPGFYEEMYEKVRNLK